MGCGIAIVKYLVFVFNLVFAIIGLALLSIGVIFHLNIQSLTKSFDEDFGLAPTFLIVVGALIFLISFFGCCGAIKESNCMLITYAVFLIMILILQVAIGVFLFLAIKETDPIKADIRTEMEDMFNKYNSTVEDKKDFDMIQTEVKCCGVDGPADWKTSVPPSCCSDQSIECGTGHVTLYTTGCTEKSYTQLLMVVRSVGYVVFGICAAEIIGVLFAFCLTNSIKNQYRRGAYA